MPARQSPQTPQPPGNWPSCLQADSVDAMVESVHGIAAGFGGINLEDTVAPQCFEVKPPARRAGCAGVP